MQSKKRLLNVSCLLIFFALLFSFSYASVIASAPTAIRPVQKSAGEVVDVNFSYTDTFACGYDINIFKDNDPSTSVAKKHVADVCTYYIESTYFGPITHYNCNRNIKDIVVLSSDAQTGSYTTKVTVYSMVSAGACVASLMTPVSSEEKASVLINTQLQLCGGMQCLSATQQCCSGICHSPICNVGIECDDSNSMTVDSCLNAGSCNASCSHVSLSCTDANCTLLQEICENNIDDNNNGQIDENCTTLQEICGNNSDDNNNGLVDENCLITPTDDPDKDGLTNAQEQAFGTNPQDADTDGDSLSDSFELKTSKTNPRDPDTDGDNVPDDQEWLYDKTNPLEAKSNLLSVVFSKSVMVGEKQKIFVEHPVVPGEILKKCKKCVSGILKGMTANIIQVSNGKGIDVNADANGIIEFSSPSEDEFHAIIYKNKFFGSADFRALSTISVAEGFIVDLGKSLFGQTATTYPILLLLLILLALIEAILVYKKSVIFFSLEVVPTSIKQRQKLARAIIAVLFFAAPLAISRFSSNLFYGFVEVILEYAVIFLIVYWEKSKKQLEKLKPIQVEG